MTRHKEMTQKEKREVRNKLEWEGGFEYFITGSSFPEITDPEFRSCYNALKKAWTDMEEFLDDYDEDAEEEDSDATSQ